MEISEPGINKKSPTEVRLFSIMQRVFTHLSTNYMITMLASLIRRLQANHSY